MSPFHVEARSIPGSDARSSVTPSPATSKPQGLEATELTRAAHEDGSPWSFSAMSTPEDRVSACGRRDAGPSAKRYVVAEPNRRAAAPRGELQHEDVVAAAVLTQERGAEDEERPVCSSPAGSSSRRQNSHGHSYPRRSAEALQPELRRAEHERRTPMVKDETTGRCCTPRPKLALALPRSADPLVDHPLTRTTIA